MKTWKRILALIGAITLGGIYLCTLIFACIHHPAAFTLFKVAIGLTILVPVLLYAMILIARLLHSKESSSRENLSEKK